MTNQNPTNYNKSIIGTPRKNYYKEIPDLTDEIIAWANEPIEPEKPKGSSKVNTKKGSNLESKVKGSDIIIPQISGDLSFVNDVNFCNEIIKYLDKTFPNHKDILSKKLSFNDEESVMKGSNPYIAIAIDNYLKSINSEYRIANQIDLEQNLLMFKNFYIDSGLKLKNLSNDTNKSQAIHLFNQLKQKGLSENDLPIWLNLRGLIFDNDLNFNLTDESSYKINAECLNWESGTHYSVIDNDFGLPKKEDKSSNRQIWTNDDALSRCYLERGLESVLGRFRSCGF
jgi:hypothetical protein